ncbi:zinc-binding metallopeptidase family protein, partial [Frankia canadensis]|uniref:zinc-binding metallopeptidase family protein n=1 Tax=Frankia canadensis TaxID=1836972 RepID=UPI000C7E57DE
MKVSGCARCGQLVFFENTACLRCEAPLGFDPGQGRVVTLMADTSSGSGEPDGDLPGVLRELPPVAVSAGVAERDRRRYRRCAGARAAGCNWLVAAPADRADDPDHPDHPDELCACCRLTRTRPADTDEVGRERFARAEAAKRRLVAQLLDLGLPVTSQLDDPERGLAFDLLNSADHPVVTGHSDGVITLDLAESDDAHRERVRTRLGEPYRTLLGHFRHEVGHYFWSSLVADEPDRAARFRALFGDPDIDYAAALRRHYAEGPPPAWDQTHVSAYATMHPWEDWAETFAHYLHIRDTLRTSAEFGLHVDGPDLAAFGVAPDHHAAEPGDPAAVRAGGGIAGIISQWLPLTYALNAINRSMGRDDLYPFVLTAAVQAKLAFVHDAIAASAGEVTPRPREAVTETQTATRVAGTRVAGTRVAGTR